MSDELKRFFYLENERDLVATMEVGDLYEALKSSSSSVDFPVRAAYDLFHDGNQEKARTLLQLAVADAIPDTKMAIAEAVDFALVMWGIPAHEQEPFAVFCRTVTELHDLPPATELPTLHRVWLLANDLLQSDSEE